MIASLDLDKLGWLTSWQRRFDLVDALYVVGPAAVQVVEGYRWSTFLEELRPGDEMAPCLAIKSSSREMDDCLRQGCREVSGL